MNQHENGLNQDGTFRARRIGTHSFSLDQIYSSMVTMSWSRFFFLIFITYLTLTALFTLAYVLVDFENLNGLTSTTRVGKILEIFLYSAQTLSTVGGVGITLSGIPNNLMLTLESMAALLYMAIITGLLFIRFSRPTAKIAFSEKAVIAPYKEVKALMIRIANAKRNEILELTARVFFIVFDPLQNKRNFKELSLEQSNLPFSSTTWTIVHPIVEGSPFFDIGKDQLDELRHNVIIYIGAIDSISGQSINSRQAYSKQDILWDTKFLPCTEMNEEGEILVYLDKISDYEEIK